MASRILRGMRLSPSFVDPREDGRGPIFIKAMARLPPKPDLDSGPNSFSAFLPSNQPTASKTSSKNLKRGRSRKSPGLCQRGTRPPCATLILRTRILDSCKHDRKNQYKRPHDDHNYSQKRWFIGIDILGKSGLWGSRLCLDFRRTSVGT
ncbi:hypothetical protein BX600DRAFT_448894 [Xylariales sp. PMI_506]|nr:hypothetical protein BX600DRAFT_448894 [Xylariales sp. PMI_506]